MQIGRNVYIAATPRRDSGKHGYDLALECTGVIERWKSTGPYFSVGVPISRGGIARDSVDVLGGLRAVCIPNRLQLHRVLIKSLWRRAVLHDMGLNLFEKMAGVRGLKQLFPAGHQYF